MAIINFYYTCEGSLLVGRYSCILRSNYACKSDADILTAIRRPSSEHTQLKQKHCLKYKIEYKMNCALYIDVKVQSPVRGGGVRGGFKVGRTRSWSRAGS